MPFAQYGLPDVAAGALGGWGRAAAGWWMGTDLKVDAIDDALRNAGIHTIRSHQFSRGGPCFLVAKDGINRPLLWVNSGQTYPNRPQAPKEIERYIPWANYGPSPAVPMALFVNSPAEAVAAANQVMGSVGSLPPDTSLPEVVFAPSGPTAPADAFQNAFKHDAYGSWTSFSNAPPGDRIILGEAQESPGVSVDSALVNFIIKNGDPVSREAWDQATGHRHQAGDIVDCNFEVAFAPDFPVVPTTRFISVARLSAWTNGTPPFEFLVKANGAGVETLWLRHIGGTHDTAIPAESTLDAAGGYLWSTPITRAAANYSNMNWIKLTLRYFAATDSTAWVELYRNYAPTPVLARTALSKTLTDTSGTVNNYFRVGQNRHSSLTGDSRIIIANAWCDISRP